METPIIHFTNSFFFVRKKNGQTGTVLFPSTHSTFQPPSPSAALNSTSILHRELLFSPPPLYVTYQSFRYRRLLVNSLCQNLAQLCKKPTYRYSRKQSVEGFHSFCQSYGVLFSIKDYIYKSYTRNWNNCSSLNRMILLSVIIALIFSNTRILYLLYQIVWGFLCFKLFT